MNYFCKQIFMNKSASVPVNLQFTSFWGVMNYENSNRS